MKRRRNVPVPLGTGVIFLLTLLALALAPSRGEEHRGPSRPTETERKAFNPASGTPQVASEGNPIGKPSDDESHEILILQSPRMKWRGFDPSIIRFDHTAHQETVEMRCEICHDRIAQEHPDPKLTMLVAHAVCRHCHIALGSASAHMGCNDCHRKGGKISER